MAIDFTRYQPPGVYTESVGGPQLAVRSTVPTAVAIFGRGIGYQTHRESVVIPQDVQTTDGYVAGTSEKLAKRGIKVVVDTDIVVTASDNVDITAPGLTINEVDLVYGNIVQLAGQDTTSEDGLYTWVGEDTPLVPFADTFKVVDPVTGVAKVRGRDYEVVRLTVGDETGSTTAGRRDDTYAIKRVRDEGTTIEEGDTVQLSYRYTDPEYHQVHALYDYDDVRDRYGEPFRANGTVQAPITLAAKFAFLNGASTVLTCAIDEESVWATGESAGSPKSLQQRYQDALNLLADEEQIAIVVPATGDAFIYDMVKAHVNEQSNARFERRALVGIDGSVAKVPTATRIDLAQSITSRRVAMVSPSQFDYYAPELNKLEPTKLGGQYMAAAIAGKSVSQIAAMPLTRKVISGFYGPTVDDEIREGAKNYETQNGLMVVERTRRNQVQVRHGVTTDPTDMLTTEWSIVGQEDVMIYRVRDYLDADGLIGMPIYDTTLIQVKASAEAALQSLIRDEIIVGFQNLKVRQLATRPDVIEVRYEWKPAYPLNYIVIRYSVSVMTGDVTPTEGIVANNNG